MNQKISNHKQKIGLSANALKIIACISMLCSHIYLCLRLPPSFLILNQVGRLAFPIFCFLLVEGFFHTKNWKRYLKRLLLFALLSEIPFDLALSGSLFYPQHQNVLFTLAAGLLVLVAVNKTPDRLGQAGWIFLGSFIVYYLKTDYSAFGIIVIATFYYFRSDKIKNLMSCLFVQLVLSSCFYTNLQKAAAFSTVFLAFYNGKAGKRIKWLFYVFYPLHLLILYFIREISR